MHLKMKPYYKQVRQPDDTVAHEEHVSHHPSRIKTLRSWKLEIKVEENHVESAIQ